MHVVKYQSLLILLLWLALNIASVYCWLFTLLFNATINGLHLYGPALCFRFQNDKNNYRRNFSCIPPQDAFVMIKEKIFASSVRSCTVYGPCIPRALSKAVGYPQLKVFVHNVLLSLRNPIHERRQKYQRGWLYGHTNRWFFLTWMSKNKICAGRGGYKPG